MPDQAIGKLDAMPSGTLMRVDIDGMSICVARLADGTVHAIEDRCTHEDYSLSEGELIGDEVECPQHSSRFDLRTGSPTGLPALIDARVFPTSVRDGEIYVDV
jgi:3-phenylpropionate/trans-cinnamate dioxygenase ferredoxin subunit